MKKIMTPQVLVPLGIILVVLALLIMGGLPHGHDHGHDQANEQVHSHEGGDPHSH